MCAQTGCHVNGLRIVDRNFYDPFINFFLLSNDLFGGNWQIRRRPSKRPYNFAIKIEIRMHLMDNTAITAAAATVVATISMTITKIKAPNNICNYSAKDPSTTTILKPIHFVRTSELSAQPGTSIYYVRFTWNAAKFEFQHSIPFVHHYLSVLFSSLPENRASIESVTRCDA